jgi:hypothetical protein
VLKANLGKAGPILLLRPYEADVTQLVLAGENTLEVTVVNSLMNAMAARGPSTKPIPGVPTAPPHVIPAGLIGPGGVVVAVRSAAFAERVLTSS